MRSSGYPSASSFFLEKSIQELSLHFYITVLHELNDIILKHFKLRKILENYKEPHRPFIKTPHSSFTSCAHDPQSRVTWCKFGVNYTRKWPNLAPCYISPISFSLERFPFLALSSTLLTFGRYQGCRLAKMLLNLCLPVSSWWSADDRPWAGMTQALCGASSFPCSGATPPRCADAGIVNVGQFTVW